MFDKLIWEEQLMGFCGRSCSRKHANITRTTDEATNHIQRLAMYQQQATTAAALVNKKGEFTYYLKKARSRTKLKETVWAASNLTEEYLAELWSQQQGKCAWTGYPLILATSNNRNCGLYSASLDRIDSSIGYVQGNVQFVMMPLNLAKGNYGEMEFRNFLNSIGISTT